MDPAFSFHVEDAVTQAQCPKKGRKKLKDSFEDDDEGAVLPTDNGKRLANCAFIHAAIICSRQASRIATCIIGPSKQSMLTCSPRRARREKATSQRSLFTKPFLVLQVIRKRPTMYWMSSSLSIQTVRQGMVARDVPKDGL